MLNKGLKQSINNIDPIEFIIPSNNCQVKLHFEDAHINYSMLPVGTIGAKSQFIYPSECRQRAATYKGKLVVTLAWSVDGKAKVPIDKDMGEIPLMLKVLTNII